MGKFSLSKNGYDANEVDEYVFKLTEDYENKLREQKMRINDLKRELTSAKDQLDGYKQKNNNISDALVVAVETAKQIENSSKNIYELEIKRIRSLYDKWKNFLDDFMKKYPELRSKYDTKLLLEVFANDIDKILKQNQKTIEQKEVVAMQTNDISNNTIGLRMLINKMGNVNRPIIQTVQKTNAQIIRNQKPSDKTLAEYQVEMMEEDESRRLQKDKIKPIVNMELSKDDTYENLVDKFLTSDDDTYQDSAYSKILLEKQKNEGFNLKDAVTPTEDLTEIMKSFSFFPENEEDGDK